MGIEKIVHASFLAKVIEKVRQMALGETTVGDKCSIYVNKVSKYKLGKKLKCACILHGYVVGVHYNQL